MKTKLFLLLTALSVMGSHAQDVRFTFANARNTSDGANDYYEADIFIASSADIKLGSGLLYFNYNPLAFGDNVKTSGNFEFLQPAGSILAERHAIIPIGAYNSFVVNNNTSSRIAVSFQQGLASGAMTANNVTSIPRHLLSIKIKYINVNVAPNVEFETQPVFLDQFFTACGGSVDALNFGLPNCTSEPGIQLKNDFFDSTGAEPTTLGVDDPVGAGLLGIAVYPNPVVDNLFVKGSTENIDAVKIYNVTGKLVKNISVKSLQTQLDVADLYPGMYFLQLISGQSDKTIKLIKK